jgi:acyltransferase
MSNKNNTFLRVVWIDIARGLGILSVVVFHSGFLPFSIYLVPLVNSWMIAIFVFTGGYLFKPNLTISYLFSKIKTLLIPYFIVGSISFLGWLYLRNNYPEKILWQPENISLINFISGKNLIFNGPLWFLPTYFFATIITNYLSKFWFGKTNPIKFIIAVLLIITAFIISRPFQYFIYSYDLILLFSGLIMLGSIAASKNLLKSLNLLSTILIFIIFLFSSLINGGPDMFERQFHNPALYIISASLGSILISFIGVKIISYFEIIKRFFIYLGKSSLIILVWHWPIMQWLTYIIYKINIFNFIINKYTLTSFVINARGVNFILIQIICCIFYVAITLFIIYGIQKLTKIIFKKL